MRCEYCDVEVTTYPEDGICIHCGGKLPPKPAVNKQAPVQPVFIPIQQPAFVPVSDCCNRCRSTQVQYQKRGFRWGLAILGFVLIPPFGLLLGFCGSKKIYGKCSACGHKWKRI